MKIAAFETKEYEHDVFLEATNFCLDLQTYAQPLTEKNVHLAKGCDGITTLGFSDLSERILSRLHEYGVKYVATRTVGFNHIDLNAAKKYGIRVSNSRYEPYNVADFTVMLILMLLRKAKVSVVRALVNDFSLDGLCGREMRNLTIGVVGTGKIGRAVIENLRGFGCKILAYDPFVDPATLPAATFTDIDTLYRESDVVTLHMPLTGKNKHMIDKSVFDKMKKGALLINTARGALVKTGDLIEAIETGKLGGAGIDTIEEEEGIAHVDLRAKIVNQHDLFYLKQFPNVIFTSHYAFFTEEATAEMVRCSLCSFACFRDGTENPYEVQ